METQHQVIISLGSNVGDRTSYLQNAIDSIHQEVATVVSVSRLYQTPSWGFESAAFYNAAILVHTMKSPNELLVELQSVEQKLGRVRQVGVQGYTDRTIDIDIIVFDELEIDTPQLKIPHPSMQDRRFVLEPMRDLHWNWKHPVLNKSIVELIATTKDNSECVVVGELINPLDKIRLQSVNYIAIEGNIGAGKTTLSNKISEDFNAKLVLERFADNPFLPKFYKDQARYAFPLEMSFLADRYQQLSDDLSQFDLFKDFLVADYHIFKSLIFAKVTLMEDEYRLYKTMFDIIHKEMPKPDLYVYLYQSTDRLLDNIKKRGRSYEQDIPAEYLESINKGYLDYIKTQTHLNVLVIDVSSRDFVQNQQDYVYILEQFQSAVATTN